jgi:hypothetical protein
MTELSIDGADEVLVSWNLFNFFHVLNKLYLSINANCQLLLKLCLD